MRLVVEGMTCSHCVRTISRALTQLDPAATVVVDLDAGEVAIDGKVELAAAIDAVTRAGYPVVAILEAGGSAIEQDARPACCGTPESAVSLL